MPKKQNVTNKQFPVFVEKDEDGFYVVECPLFRGCYSQGKTLDELECIIKQKILLRFQIIKLSVVDF